MQVDPIKPTLKAPGIELFKLQCDKPLSKFGFNFNLRRFNENANFTNFGNAMLVLVRMATGEAGPGRCCQPRHLARLDHCA